MHWVPGSTSGYALVVGKHGPKLTQYKVGEPVPPDLLHVRLGAIWIPGTSFVPVTKSDGRKEYRYYNVSMEVLAGWLAQNVGARIVDQTGLAGNYDFILNSLELGDQAAHDPGPSVPWDLDALGLKLVPVKIPTNRLVVDHMERPSAN